MGGCGGGLVCLNRRISDIGHRREMKHRREAKQLQGNDEESACNGSHGFGKAHDDDLRHPLKTIHVGTVS